LNRNYKETYQNSINNKEKFWKDVSDDIFWYKKPTKILNSDNPPFYKWFEDGVTNTCYNALDLHIDNGRGDKLAIIYDSPITGIQKKITYSELRNEVALFAGALKKQGINKGDRVIIYMPMIPQAVVAMLACGRIGAVHSVVFGGFAANELASRIDDSKSKLIVTASCGYEPGRTVHYKPLVNKAIELANHKPNKCIIFQREKDKAELDPSMDIT
jgi:propionyl-CoA synthetase